MCSDPEFSTRFAVYSLVAGLGMWLAGCAHAPVAPPVPLTTAQQAPAQGKPGQRCAPPAWPADVLRSVSAGFRGTTVIRFLIGTDGVARDAVLVQSSGFESLDKAAESSLRICRFEPTQKDGKPVEAWHPVEYTWSIE